MAIPRKDPETPKITGLTDYDAFCGVVCRPGPDPAPGRRPPSCALLELPIRSSPTSRSTSVSRPEWDINHIEGAS